MVWAVVLIGFIIKLYILKRSRGKIIQLERGAPCAPCAVVLGAKVRDNSPSQMLEDRLHTAVDCYRKGLAQRLHITGRSDESQQEVQVMRRFLLDRGIPDHHLVIDGDSRNTRESFRRLPEFHGEKECLLITQRFHMARSLFLAEEYGFKPRGIEADRRLYKNRFFMLLREFFATTKEFLIPRR